MNHLQFADLESANLNTNWDRKFAAFLNDVAYVTGLTDEYGPQSLDGDRSDDNPNRDPACLDELREWFESGMSTCEAWKIINDRQHDIVWRDSI